MSDSKKHEDVGGTEGSTSAQVDAELCSITPVEDKSSGSSVEPYPLDLRGYRLRKHACLVCTWFVMGLYSEIVGPTLPALRRRLGVNYEELSRAVVAKNGGMLLGSLAGGVLHEHYHQRTDMLMFLSHLVAATGTAVVSFCPNLLYTGIALSLPGLAMGVINTGGNTMAMELWGDKASSPMQLLHCGVGVGALIVPHLVSAFHPHPRSEVNTTTNTAATAASAANKTVRGLLRNASTLVVAAGGGSGDGAARNDGLDDAVDNDIDATGLQRAYLTIAGVTLAFSTVWLYYTVCGLPTKLPVRVRQGSFVESLSPGSCFDGKHCYGTALLCVLFFYFFQAVGGEHAMGKFLFTFAISEGLDHETAAWILSTFWLCYTLGRLLGFVIGHVVSVNTMVCVDVIGCAVCSLVLVRYAGSSILVLWLFSSLIAAFISVLFPSGMAWANRNMRINSMAVMIYMVGGSAGGLSYEYACGALFEVLGPPALFYLVVAQAAGLAVTFTIMMLIVGGERKREKIRIRKNREGELQMEEASQNPLVLDSEKKQQAQSKESDTNIYLNTDDIK